MDPNRPCSVCLVHHSRFYRLPGSKERQVSTQSPFFYLCNKNEKKSEKTLGPAASRFQLVIERSSTDTTRLPSLVVDHSTLGVANAFTSTHTHTHTLSFKCKQTENLECVFCVCVCLVPAVQIRLMLLPRRISSTLRASLTWRGVRVTAGCTLLPRTMAACWCTLFLLRKSSRF